MKSNLILKSAAMASVLFAFFIALPGCDHDRDEHRDHWDRQDVTHRDMDRHDMDRHDDRY